MTYFDRLCNLGRIEVNVGGDEFSEDIEKIWWLRFLDRSFLVKDLEMWKEILAIPQEATTRISLDCETDTILVSFELKKEPS